MNEEDPDSLENLLRRLAILHNTNPEIPMPPGIPRTPIDHLTRTEEEKKENNRSLVERAAALGIQIPSPPAEIPSPPAEIHSTPAESKWAAAQNKAKRLMELRKQMGMLPNEPNKDSFHNNHNANTGSGILVGSGKKKKKTRRKRRKRKTKTKRKRKRRTRKKRR
jgi:hypothetical protein